MIVKRAVSLLKQEKKRKLMVHGLLMLDGGDKNKPKPQYTLQL
jgi:hypothetical protein